MAKKPTKSSSKGKKNVNKKTAKRRSLKKKKDPKAPKRPRSAYILFCTEIREQLKSENPDAKPSDLLSMMGKLWKEMSDDQKQQYLDNAAADKGRYENEMSRYDAPDESDDSDDDGRRKKKRKHKDPNEPKRALSAYLYFGQDKREYVKRTYPDAKQPEIIKIIGDLWRNLTPDQKVKYEAQANADKARYVRDKANYESTRGSGRGKASRQQAPAAGYDDEEESEEEDDDE